MRNYHLIAVLLSLFLAGVIALEITNERAQAQTDRFTVSANKLVTAINTGEVDSIYVEFGDQVKQAFTLEKAKAYFQSLTTQHGKIVKLEPPKLTPPLQATFLVHFEKADMELKLYLDGQDKILGFGFSPASVATPTPQVNDSNVIRPKPVTVKPSSAEDLFKAGLFAEAENAYAKRASADKKDYQAALHLGHLALLNNRFDTARKWLTIATQLKPEEKAPLSLLAETAYRQDEFSKASRFFAKAGRDVKAKQIGSFKGLTPYQVEGSTDVLKLKFVQTDPLPLVQVKVNSSETVYFLIDTGGGETILDIDFAKEVGAITFGSEMGTFGANTQAETGLGKIDSLTLGDWTIKNLPIHTLNTKPFNVATSGKKVSGIIGTNLLYHFISTIDYQNGELALQKRSKSALDNLAKQKLTSIPFWLAGDHLIVAWGTANRSQPILMLVDTGLGGNGFVCPQSTLDEIGVKLSNQGIEGTFGGGKAKIFPFTIDELTLGDIKREKIGAIFGAFPTKLEYGQGFRIGGLISHTFFRSYALTFDFSGMKLWVKTS